jgi:DNA-binding transcriptional MerR regulator
MTIQQLSNEIGVGIDTLRIWERRYGFPVPARSARGHRSYSVDQVEELRIVKKLQTLGHRPGKIFALSPDQRRQLLSAAVEQRPLSEQRLKPLTQDLSPGQIDAELREQLQHLGLVSFIHQYALPLLQRLDQGWTDGSISIAREHLISDRLELLLREQLVTKQLTTEQTVSAQETKSNKQLLFLTLSGERHKLGLLLAATLFHAEGIDCILLNHELPLSELPDLANELRVDGVALSFSGQYSARQAKADLASLRNQLNPQVKLIAGGQAVQGGVKMQNLTICTDLKQIPGLCSKLFQ